MSEIFDDNIVVAVDVDDDDDDNDDDNDWFGLLCTCVTYKVRHLILKCTNVYTFSTLRQL